ncbi:MAG TPA: hypothetical protein VGI70_06140 [Polyangiales bacterium]|jgi:hypothetical protein
MRAANARAGRVERGQDRSRARASKKLDRGVDMVVLLVTTSAVLAKVEPIERALAHDDAV